jgi:hypothetical protein
MLKKTGVGAAVDSFSLPDAGCEAGWLLLLRLVLRLGWTAAASDTAASGAGSAGLGAGEAASLSSIHLGC